MFDQPTVAVLYLYVYHRQTFVTFSVSRHSQVGPVHCALSVTPDNSTHSPSTSLALTKKKQKYHQRNNYFALFMFSLLSFLNPLHLTYWYVLYWCYCDLAFQSWIVQLSFDVAALILSNSMGDHVYVLIKEIQTPTKFPSSSEFGQIESI